MTKNLNSYSLTNLNLLSEVQLVQYIQYIPCIVPSNTDTSDLYLYRIKRVLQYSNTVESTVMLAAGSYCTVNPVQCSHSGSSYRRRNSRVLGYEIYGMFILVKIWDMILIPH